MSTLPTEPRGQHQPSDRPASLFQCDASGSFGSTDPRSASTAVLVDESAFAACALLPRPSLSLANVAKYSAKEIMHQSEAVAMTSVSHQWSRAPEQDIPLAVKMVEALAIWWHM